MKYKNTTPHPVLLEHGGSLITIKPGQIVDLKLDVPSTSCLEPVFPPRKKETAPKPKVHQTPPKKKTTKVTEDARESDNA